MDDNGDPEVIVAEDPKPCPFCGAEAKFNKLYTDAVECPNQKCPIHGIEKKSSRRRRLELTPGRGTGSRSKSKMPKRNIASSSSCSQIFCTQRQPGRITKFAIKPWI